MAIMYARSTLTSWDTSVVGGWSNTSGGVSNGLVPSSTTDVIFDANSGAARTITIDGASTPQCKSIDTTGSAGMTFSQGTIGGPSFSGNVNLTSTVNWNTALQMSGTASLTAPSTSIKSIAGTTVNLTLLSSISVVQGVSGLLSLNANNFNISATSLSFTGAGTFTMGSGTFTLSGTNPLSGISSTTIIPNTSTIRCTNPTAATFTGLGYTYNNFWNDSPGGAITIDSSNQFNNFRMSAGAIQKFTAGTNTTVNSLTADGTGGQVTIDSTTTSPFTLTKAGGGTNYSDYITISHCTGSPASTWYARNSVNGGTNTNWTFIPGNSKFLQFC